ncbi:MAG: rhomboid family intramembrane serine protease [Ignavibacteriales bacterium]|nr:rhomboid family intramembrane serine protease [Ignavibacteriales bacterium]
MSWSRRSSGYNYYRPSFFGGFQFFPPVIKWLLLTNVAVFFLASFLQGFTIGEIPLRLVLAKLLYLFPLGEDFQVWQLFTYMFMHGGFTHIFFNMFALWMFGMKLENEMGSKKFLYFYMVCGVGAGLCNLFIAPLFTEVGPTVGASGAVYGILLAFGLMFPDDIVFMWFIPMPAKFFVGIYMAIELYSGVTGTQDGVAHFAHLGGAAVGILFLMVDAGGFSGTNIFQRITDSFASRKPNGYNEESGYARYEVEKEERYFQNENDVDQERIDEILDKISKSGYEKLTDDEKKILFEASKKLN